jgi:hypothetical protein
MSRRKKLSVPLSPEWAARFAKLADPKTAAELDKARKSIIEALALRDGYVRPPWQQGPKQDAKLPAVSKKGDAKTSVADTWLDHLYPLAFAHGDNDPSANGAGSESPQTSSV